ncbi:hypothetical protein GLOIN_2v1488957 [Rhizophagus clarus]|uniref:Uncharacterized protein n=1 Tax=Rhizophagus clarus TaxID=94130 RepID=A0A8H3LVA9_9GLOM|nr:hypothetical protein GLOIN_2v1488957 [Rhizophagus clarus]
MNKKKRKQEDDDDFDYLYSIVGTDTSCYALDKESAEYQTLRNGVEKDPPSKKMRITELEAENVEIAELKKENVELRKENTDFRMKFANFESERAEFKRRIAETLKMTDEERTRRDAENVKLRATIEELKSENIEKIVSSEIKQHNKEKKLQAQESLPTHPEEKVPQELNSCNRSHKKKRMDELKYELFNSPSETDSPSSINHNIMTEVSETARPKKFTCDGIDETSHHLAQLCDKAIDAEDRANRANQEEILCWCLYWKDFRNQLIRNGGSKFGEKKARSILYDTITGQLSIPRKKRSQELGVQLRNVSRDSLRKKTQRAEKNYKLFEKVGLDKIKYINSYSVNSISELTDAQFQEIIDYGISLEKLSPEAGHVSEISETARPEKILPEVNAPSTPQITPAKADDNDLTDLKEEDFCGGERM